MIVTPFPFGGVVDVDDDGWRHEEKDVEVVMVVVDEDESSKREKSLE